MHDANCPYCNAEVDIDHDDGIGLNDDEQHEQYCSECDKYFMCTTSIIYLYETKKADCLNGSKHDFQPTTTYPKHFTQMRCSMCCEERNPTDQERAMYSIPTFEEEYEALNGD